MSKRKRLKPGDLLQVKCDDCTGHLYYLGRHPEYGEAVRVVKAATLPANPDDLDAALSKGYDTFYPATAAIAQEIVIVVGHHEAGLLVPSKLRRPGAMDRNGTVLTWVIEEFGRERVTGVLTDDERDLPIAAIWNHEMLCTRLREGWRPGNWH